MLCSYHQKQKKQNKPIKGHRGTSGDDRYVSYLDCDDGNTSIYIYI